MSEIVEISREQWQAFLDTNDLLIKKCEELIRQDKELSVRNTILEGKIRQLEEQLQMRSSEDRLVRPNNIDAAGRTSNPLLIVALLLGVLAWKLFFAVQMRIPVWDGCVYLSNARLFTFGNTSFFEVIRPPLFPFTVACIWRITGESLLLASLVQPGFTVAAGLVFYLFAKEARGSGFATVSTAIFLLGNTAMSYWTNHILVHGETLFFLVLSSYSIFKAARGRPKFWWIAGAAAGLATLARYPALFAVGGIACVVLHPKFRKNNGFSLDMRTGQIVSADYWNLVKGVSAFFIVWFPWFAWNWLVYGDFLYSITTGSGAVTWGSHDPLYFYIVHAPETWGLAVILLLVAIFSRDTWQDDCGFMLLLWFLFCLVGFSIIRICDSRLSGHRLSLISLHWVWKRYGMPFPSL